jgi:L-lactate dehydrogenase
LLSGLASEIVLIDANQAKAEGEAMDLNHAVPLAQPGHVWAGKYADCAGAAITVVTAGSAQRPGETRLDLTTRNTEIFRQIIPQIAKHNPEGILLIATNPVDVLTYASQKFSGLSPRQVFGSGTILDTARFRYLLSQHFGVDARSVHAYIIGEHGDSEVPVWSLANIAGMHIPEFCAFNGYNCNDPELENIFERTRDAAYQIISRKGATYYAIGSGLLRIVEAVLRDQNTVLSISSLIEDYYGLNDVCFSLPTIIDRGGVERVLHLELDPTEIEGLRSSAEVLKSTIKSLHL